MNQEVDNKPFEIQLMENNILTDKQEYYKPSEDDLFIGYECEKLVVGEYQEWYEPFIIKAKNWEFGLKGFPTDVCLNATLRTPYLCKQDIIDLRWTQPNIERPFFRIEYFNENTKTPHLYSLILYPNNSIQITDYGRTIFFGNCKSKNELKKLMKDYLNIPI